MISPSFLNVSLNANQKFKLSDLKVSGYTAEEGSWGSFKLSVLDNAGRETAEYFWWDYDGYYTPGWYDINGETKYDDSTIEFEAGQAFWTQGAGLNVVGSGLVNTETVICKTAGGTSRVAIGNPFPVELKLSNIYVTGYTAEEGSWGSFKLAVLDTAGRESAEYFWWDYEGYYLAGWYDINGETQYDAEKIPVPVGQGFWVQGAGLNINFDKISL